MGKKKPKPASPLYGRWKIVSMTEWDEDYIHGEFTSWRAIRSSERAASPWTISVRRSGQRVRSFRTLIVATRRTGPIGGAGSVSGGELVLIDIMLNRTKSTKSHCYRVTVTR